MGRSTPPVLRKVVSVAVELVLSWKNSRAVAKIMTIVQFDELGANRPTCKLYDVQVKMWIYLWYFCNFYKRACTKRNWDMESLTHISTLQSYKWPVKTESPLLLFPFKKKNVKNIQTFLQVENESDSLASSHFDSALNFCPFWAPINSLRKFSTIICLIFKLSHAT